MRETPPNGMTNPTLMAYVRNAVQTRVEREVDPTAEKTALLDLVLADRGPREVFEIGLGARDLPSNPVFDALAAAPSPRTLLERWQRLERFGHTRHRTRFHAHDNPDEESLLRLEHYAIDGATIAVVDDLFIWGLLVGLLQLAGFLDIDAVLFEPGSTRAIYRRGGLVPFEALPSPTSCLELVVGGRVRERGRIEPPRLPSAAAREALEALIATDLLHGWSLDEAAQRLALSRRQLQRELQAAGTTFSATLTRLRIEAARSMMHQNRLSLTEIAFCVGFADSAHFSRHFRRLFEVPPVAYRELLVKGGGS